jgi:hypothetical protein
MQKQRKNARNFASYPPADRYDLFSLPVDMCRSLSGTSPLSLPQLVNNVECKSQMMIRQEKNFIPDFDTEVPPGPPIEHIFPNPPDK